MADQPPAAATNDTMKRRDYMEQAPFPESRSPDAAGRPALAGSTACCDLYEGAMAHLDGFILAANARAGRGDLYKNPPFRYCPWCGRERP